MPSVYRPRRIRASPLWQVVHHSWKHFVANYETAAHRKIHGPLRRDTVAVVDQFYRCGDLAAGFTRLQCPDCGHEKLLAFTCKTRHFCPSCHQRRVRALGDWIAHEVCFEVPHRQFVFTMPRPLRGIFRKRRKLLDHLFRVSIECLRDWMRTRLDLPDGKLADVAAVQTFGDYLNFHPHLHVLAATGLVDRDGRFHLMPVEQRRGTGVVSDGGEAEARRVRPRAERANQTMEPLDVPPQWGWSDEIEPPPEDWWRGEEEAWQAPELSLDDGQVLVLDADDPFPADEWPVYREG